MRIFIAAVAALALSLSAPAAAQAPAPLFASSDPIALTIKAPLSSVMRDREGRGSVAGTLVDPAGHNLPVNLELRGLTRRTADICDFPPLRVQFVQAPPATSLFAGQNRLKLVTHCRNSASFQQQVLLEYAAYQMYNVLTPRSFRVRLANINYQDASGRPIISRVGFFIEEVRDVARRNGTSEVRAAERIPVAYLSPPDAARAALFEHMIGNHDWSMRAGPVGDECCHNFKLIGVAAPGATIPVPYDFDYSGLVGAPYATPPDQLGISDVRQRFFRGYCMHNAHTVAAAQQMRQARPQILAALAQVPGLTEGTKRNASNYLDRFFADIGSDADVTSKVLRRCVG